MIRLLQSKRVKIPLVYLIENEEDLEQLPLGIPFIKGQMKDYRKCVQMLEWDVLWSSAIATGLPFNWKSILRSKGFRTWEYGIANSEGWEKTNNSAPTEEATEFDWVGETIDSSTFINDVSYKVDIDVLKNLNLIPVWVDDIEAAIKENITTSVAYNPSLYTKKLDLPLGDYEFAPAVKNIIGIDISRSIPRGVSQTLLVLAKTLCEKFYADLFITGSITTLYDYSEVDSLDIDELYSINGMGNEGEYYRAMVKEPMKYKTAIVFGDNHNAGSFLNTSDEEGKKICKWEIDELLSFHTTSKTELAGYARWFDPKTTTHMTDWVKDLNKY